MKISTSYDNSEELAELYQPEFRMKSTSPWSLLVFFWMDDCPILKAFVSLDYLSDISIT